MKVCRRMTRTMTTQTRRAGSRKNIYCPLDNNRANYGIYRKRNIKDDAPQADSFVERLFNIHGQETGAETNH